MICMQAASNIRCERWLASKGGMSGDGNRIVTCGRSTFSVYKRLKLILLYISTKVAYKRWLKHNMLLRWYNLWSTLQKQRALVYERIDKKDNYQFLWDLFICRSERVTSSPECTCQITCSSGLALVSFTSCGLSAYVRHTGWIWSLLFSSHIFFEWLQVLPIFDFSCKSFYHRSVLR